MNEHHDHWLMCVHEAAHAVIGVAEGRGFALVEDSLTTFEGGGLLGDEARIRLTMAGFAAEHVALGEEVGLEDLASTVIVRLENEFTDSSADAGGTDGEFVFEMAARLRKTGRAQGRLLNRLALETVQAVLARWVEIETLAREVRDTLRETPDGVCFYCGDGQEKHEG